MRVDIPTAGQAINDMTTLQACVFLFLLVAAVALTAVLTTDESLEAERADNFEEFDADA